MVIPFFTPDNVPTTERFSLSDPFAGVAVRDERKPRQRYENAELALRLYRRVGSFDVSVYAYDGFWRTPGFEADPPASPERVTAVFPSLSVLGTSAQGSVLDGILSLEYGYYDSDAVGGRQPFGTPDSQNRFLVGYQREVRQDLNLGVQYYAEVSRGEIRTSAEVEAPRGDQYRDTATLRLEQLLRNQTWRVAVFTFFSPSDGDYLLQPQGSYRLSDELSLAFGANIFGGETDTFLGRFDRNDNLYGSVRFDF
jgi:hypothetical protein